MRVLICGDRNWTDYKRIYKEVQKLSDDDLVIHGAAQGADTLGSLAARRRGLMVQAFPAQWERYGRSAGPIRNQQMLDEGKPDVVWAFHPNIDVSRGTADMIARARKAGVKTVIFS